MSIATGTVSTPTPMQSPRGWLWDQLAAATTREALAEIAATSERLGYAPGGQLRTAIAARLAAIDAPTTQE